MKTTQSTSQPVAESSSGAYSGNPMQLLANKPIAANPLQLLKKAAAPAGAVQRVVNVEGLRHTAKHLYYAAEEGSRELVSGPNAPAPAPTPLFDRREDKDQNNNDVVVWTSRSKFVDKASTQSEESKPGNAGKDRDELGEAVFLRLVNEVNAAKINDGQLRLNTVGLNDCVGYAITLQILIHKYNQRKGLVGELWQHAVVNNNVNYYYHGATVIAEDLPDTVTLEGHAGKEVLPVPLFHIRYNGVTGFEADNISSAPDTFADNAAVYSTYLNYLDMAEHYASCWEALTWPGNSSAILEHNGVEPEAPTEPVGVDVPQLAMYQRVIEQTSEFFKTLIAWYGTLNG